MLKLWWVSKTMKRSQSIDLAIHALWYLAYVAPDDIVMIRDIAAKQQISESYLAKIFQNLAKSEIVLSLRGKNGGYRLGRPASEITVGDVVRALENDMADYDCDFRSRSCPINPGNCFLPAIFEEARRRMFEALDAVTIQDLAVQVEYVSQQVEWIGKN